MLIPSCSLKVRKKGLERKKLAYLHLAHTLLKKNLNWQIIIVLYIYGLQGDVLIWFTKQTLLKHQEHQEHWSQWWG